MSVIFMNIMLSIPLLLAMIMLKRIRGLATVISNTQSPAIADRYIKRLKHLNYYYSRVALFNIIYLTGVFFFTMEYLRPIPLNKMHLIIAGLYVANLIIGSYILFHALFIDISTRYMEEDTSLLARRPILLYVLQIFIATCLVIVLLSMK